MSQSDGPRHIAGGERHRRPGAVGQSWTVDRSSSIRRLKSSPLLGDPPEAQLSGRPVPFFPFFPPFFYISLKTKEKRSTVHLGPGTPRPAVPAPPVLMSWTAPITTQYRPVQTPKFSVTPRRRSPSALYRTYETAPSTTPHRAGGTPPRQSPRNSGRPVRLASRPRTAVELRLPAPFPPPPSVSGQTRPFRRDDHQGGKAQGVAIRPA